MPSATGLKLLTYTNQTLQILSRRLFGGTEGKEILGAFDRFLEAAEELLEVFAAFDEVDVGGVYHE